MVLQYQCIQMEYCSDQILVEWERAPTVLVFVRLLFDPGYGSSKDELDVLHIAAS